MIGIRPVSRARWMAEQNGSVFGVSAMTEDAVEYLRSPFAPIMTSFAEREVARQTGARRRRCEVSSGHAPVSKGR